MVDVIAPALGVLNFVRVVIVVVSVIYHAQSAIYGTGKMLASCSHQFLPATMEHEFILHS